MVTPNRSWRQRLGSGWRLLGRLSSGTANFGTCSICRGRTLFVEQGPWLRESYFCLRCRSLPRQRALIKVLESRCPDWRQLALYEPAPAGPASAALAAQCQAYHCSHYWPDAIPGSERDGVRCEDLERLTLPDASFDLVISQDVFEHVLHPNRAFAEVARVLRPGGAHVFTVPLYRREKTVVRARAAPGGGVEHLLPAEYHGNPVDPDGALVVREWGADIVDYVRQVSGLESEIILDRDRDCGLDGEFLEVIVSRKPC